MKIEKTYFNDIRISSQLIIFHGKSNGALIDLANMQ